ncbi:MAG: hypothetical protein RL757_1018 [Bacteroidota bacterium]|jgi:signal transduction histidine kinase
MTISMLPSSPASVSEASPPTRVLLIEDNPGDARLVQILLEESDMGLCEFQNVTTLSAGILALQKSDFDVILLDLTLPDSRGFDTLQNLVSSVPDANVIVMTGLSDKALGLNAVKAGAQDFLMKGGFDSDMLAKTLRYSIERKNVLRSLAESQNAREVAEESARLKEEFIAGISHEMRTPMNAIYGMSNLLNQTTMNTEQREYVNSIRQSSEVLLGVINDILEISTLQNGKMDFELKDFDLDELLSNLINVMQYKKDEKNLTFMLEVAPDMPRQIKSDKLRLNQILFNVVGNAVKFTDEGFVRIQVNKISDGEVVMARFSVQDSGIGIPTDKLDSIFEAFTRVRTKDRLFEGTGLGLAIVKNLVSLQGGRIWAESKVGEGSTIHFELPLQVATPTPQYATPADAPKVPEKAVNADLFCRLLLVEDHKMNQLVARRTLEKHFPNVTFKIANHGGEAVDILENETFDLILMDIQMPVMDGNETTEHIRTNMKHIKTPILAMTAHAYISKDNAFKAYGFNDFVLKPFELEDFFAKMHKYAGKNFEDLD